MTKLNPLKVICNYKSQHWIVKLAPAASEFEFKIDRLTRFGLQNTHQIQFFIKSKSYNSDYSRHRHWETIDDDVGVEWLQDIARQQAVVDARVLVLFELGKPVLTNVHHGRWI
jgi:hypothetical protein